LACNKKVAQTWNPSGDSRITVGGNQAAEILSLRGFEITTIRFLEKQFDLYKPRETLNNTLVQRALEHASRERTRYSEEDSLKEAMACTLTAGKSKEENKTVLYGIDDLEEYLTHGTKTVAGLRFAESIRTQRTFFYTANGYMGIGSRKMQTGDKICVLFGGEVLFILRPAGENYRLVGECYVHGLMHGEAMAMLDSGEATEQFFDLQ
jgi:hypothetical protein